MNIIPNIFKIDTNHHLLKPIKETVSILRTIIKDSYSKAGWKLKAEDLQFTEFTNNGITYYLYLYPIKDKQSEWASFLPEELRGDVDRFQQTKISLILFVKTEHELFAIVGGAAYRIVVNFIDHSYGLSTYDRIIKLTEDEAMSTKSRGITGQRIGMSEQFRDQYKMINYLQFGKIPKELHIKLAEETGDEYFDYLLSKPNERLNITVGKGFRINKQVSFETLQKIINSLTIILGVAPQDLLSSYIEVKDHIEVGELQKQLNQKIFNHIPFLLGTSRNQSDNFEFDLASPNNLEAFYEAESYQLKEKNGDKHEIFATVFDKDEIYRKVVLRAYELHPNDEVGMLFYLRGVRIHCVQGTKHTTSSGFLYHLNAEISYKGDSAFYIDTKWYKVKDAFVDSLINQTESIFKNFKLPAGILTHPWPIQPGTTLLAKEDEYNLKYDGTPGYIVMDKILPENIEICDIFYITSDELFLIHVKHSFTARVRELTNQILISARRLTEAITTKNLNYFKNLFKQINKQHKNTLNYSETEFVNMFFERKITYVFATASQLNTDLKIEGNVKKYKSNIARFSLTTCSAEMRTQYFDMVISQIPRG